MLYRLFNFVIILFFFFWQTAASQELEDYRKFSGSWFVLQAVPSYSWTSFPHETHFSFEWEATPLLYSFGMNKRVPRWHFFQVTQPERFAGSLEINISTQIYTKKISTSYWGFSGQFLTHFPLIEYGEYLGLNAGIARYTISGSSSTYLIGGFSTLFGFLHYTIKYSPADQIWMNSLEFRFF
jgi:hypothetical protein